MKTLLFTLIATFSFSSWANFVCNKKVDQKKVILFVDANNSPAEIKGAAEAACARGETFEVIPGKGQQVDGEVLKMQLRQYASKNISVSSVIASGHDGGGTIHGVQGGVDKYEIIAALKESYKTKPHLLNDMKSIYMWGCWTMGPSEVEVWKDELPNIKLAAGFMDMGPLNTTRAAHSVLKDMLIKEKSLVEESDKQKLKRAISGITDINQTLAAVYTDAICGDMYYYRTQGDHQEGNQSDNPLFTRGTHYVEFDKSFDCKTMAAEIEQKRVELIKYFYGTLPLPEDKPGSPIRGIYSFMRHASKCIKPNHILNPDRVFLLRFYEAVKENFANTFHEQIGKANIEYVGINNILKELPNGDQKSALTKYINSNSKKYFNPRKENLKSKSRKEIKDMISYLDGLTKQEVFRTPKYSGKVKVLKDLKNSMETYLYQLNPRCMDFMEWHEVIPNYSPRTSC